jgi:Pyruvate/2-oxoacid:ferredoxin oxidoreductase delta subunit/DNA-binding MarR family transcriptional regulator
MSEDIYFKLGQRLNENPGKMMLVEPFLNVLRKIYTEEQAKLGAELPIGAHKAADLAKQLNRDEKELTEMLESMADIGLIFVSKTEEGESEYALTPFVPGVLEFQLMRGTETDEDRRKARMLEDFLQAMADMTREATGDILKDPAKAKEMIRNPGLRTIPVEEVLPRGSEIYPYEHLTELIDKEDSFAAAICHCRQQAKLLGNPCQVEDAPKNSCLYFGKAADFMVDRKFAKRVSKEEAKQILKDCEKAGLVHNINNTIDKSIVLCNCCSCCCGFLTAMRKKRVFGMVANSNFVSKVDEESCIGCCDCVDRCPMDAISLVEEIASVNEDYCLGCGNCVSVCPTESLSMERTSDYKPPEIGVNIVGLGV